MPQEIIGPLLSIGAALELPVIGYVLLALVLAGVVSFATTPLVKALSVKVGAIDVPRDGRRMHDHPIPRMGGLAIFSGIYHQCAAAHAPGSAQAGDAAGGGHHCGAGHF